MPEELFVRGFFLTLQGAEIGSAKFATGGDPPRRGNYLTLLVRLHRSCGPLGGSQLVWPRVAAGFWKDSETGLFERFLSRIVGRQSLLERFLGSTRACRRAEFRDNSRFLVKAVATRAERHDVLLLVAASFCRWHK